MGNALFKDVETMNEMCEKHAWVISAFMSQLDIHDCLQSSELVNHIKDRLDVLKSAYFNIYQAKGENVLEDGIIIKSRKNKYKLIFIIILVLIFWLFLRPKTPQEQAIAKYIKEINSNSYTLTMIVKESDFIDPYPKYGRLYHVYGVIGDFADVKFFYLIEDSDGWKVDKCGTGP